MNHVAVINRSSLDDALAAFAVEAVKVQMERDVAPAWAGSIVPTVAFYSDVSKLPSGPSGVVPCVLVDKVDVEGALAYHTDILGEQFLQIGAAGELTAIHLAHELIEWFGDPTCDRWVAMPDGIVKGYDRIAAELCDPCQRDTYRIEVSILGETRSLPVCDFARPRYFETGARRADGPLTFLDTVDRAFGLSRNGGGYRMVKNALTGDTDANFGARLEDGRTFAAVDFTARDDVQAKRANPLSRLSRRLAAPIPKGLAS